MEKNYQLITILGPTASGKTSFAAALAERIGSEIISADSRQVYRRMDIGTGKDLEDYVVNGKNIPYHLINICNPGDKYNVFEYQHDFFRAFDAEGKELDNWTIFSIGGGTLANEEYNEQKTVEVYEMSKIRDIQHWCESTGHSYWEYVEECEGAEIWDYLAEVWDVMQEAVRRGLEAEGILPGGLGIRRKASDYMIRAKGYGSSIKSRGLVYAYALAVSEENACGGRIVTAPTCGSCGVLPAVLYHLKETREFRDSRILRALATAGLFGNVVRTNASISGADVGCQGEVGVACAMAAGAASQLFGGTAAQIEYASEMGLEHHLGLTCDPVGGLVQIPCIERNAFAAARALDANTFSNFSDGKHRVSFDQVVEVMRQTGKDLPSLYKETSEGGLAKEW